MRNTAAFLMLSALLLSQEVNSFSTTSSSLFRRVEPSTTITNNNKFQSAADRRRNEFPAIHNIATSSNTKLYSAAPVGAIAGVLTGGVLGGALHAIAGKCRLCFLQNDVQTST